jgi:hypothetical protein
LRRPPNRASSRSRVRVTVMAENMLTMTPMNSVSAKPRMMLAPTTPPNQ